MSELKGVIGLDIETTIASYMRRKASPYTPENWVVAIGYEARGTHGKDRLKGYYFGEQRTAPGFLSSLLRTYQPKVLTGFNIKFDIQWLIVGEEDYTAYQDWIADGGELWDSQLVEYLLDGMIEESHMLSLDEVSVRYGGEVKIDEVKAYWAKGISTEFIPEQLLMDYLIGRKERDGTIRPGDIQNTMLIYDGQVKEVVRSNRMNSIRLNNGALVAVIEMERNGLYVDMKVAEEEMARLADEIAAAEQELTKFYPADLPITLNWNSVRHKSALFFGGRVPYIAKVPLVDPADGRQMYVQKDETHYLLADGKTIETEQWDTWLEMYDLGEIDREPPTRTLNKSGKLAGQPKTKKVKVDDFDKPKFRNEEFHFTLPGYIKPKPQWKSKAYDGVYSTSKEVIEELEDEDIPFIQAFVRLTKMKKDLSTYYRVDETDDEGNIIEGKSKGMLVLVQPDGIVHHTINQTSTVTARFSHRDPNSGNLPREGTSNVKKMFRSRWLDEGRIISSDFRSLEVYCQAVLTGDKQLIADLVADIDMHCMRLSVVENKPYPEVLVLAKGDRKKGIAPLLEWERKRTDIKGYSFQRAYGAGAAAIAKKVKKPVEVVEEWIRADDERYSGIPRFNERMASLVARTSRPTKLVVNHPTAKIPLHLNRGEFRTFDGKSYAFLESPAPDFMVKKGVYQSFKPTELKNYPVQGLGAEWMKAAMWLAVRGFYKYRNFGGLALLNNTVHDAVYADAHVSASRRAGLMVHASMLAASDLMEYLFDKPIQAPVPSETTLGDSQFDQGNFEDLDQFDLKTAAVRAWLRNTFMDGYVPTFAKE